MPSVIDYGICTFEPSCTINLNFCTKTIKLFRYWLLPWTMGEKLTSYARLSQGTLARTLRPSGGRARPHEAYRIGKRDKRPPRRKRTPLTRQARQSRFPRFQIVSLSPTFAVFASAHLPTGHQLPALDIKERSCVYTRELVIRTKG